MTRYILNFVLETSDRKICFKFQDGIRKLITDYHVDGMDYELGQATREVSK